MDSGPRAALAPPLLSPLPPQVHVSFPILAAPLARALDARDYQEPTPVQTAVLEPELAGRDLLVSACTGSGKTVAYGLAAASTLFGDAEQLGEAGAPLALVIAPTRELALQVQRELAWLYEHTRARIVSCVGGMDPRRERRLLGFGAHVVVGTPGRLRDHLERGDLELGQLRVAVLDEADEMLDMGFREDLEFILDATPAQRQTLLFSATLPEGITSIAARYQRDAARVAVPGAERGHADIEYRAVRVAPNEVELVVVNVLRYVDSPSAIVFANTREGVRHLQATLQERGFAVVALSGELSQSERNRALQELRSGRARVCVATDVAARGIDLPSVNLVIHAELPHDVELLQHRSGRTGRAGRKGVSVVLVPLPRRRKAEFLFRDARLRPLWSGPPTAEAILERDRERLLSDPLFSEEIAEEEQEIARALVAAHPPEAIAAALVRLHRANLPAPEEVFDPGDPAQRRDREREEGPRRSTERPATATVWFRVNLGRRHNADPRWLLPLLSRRGNIGRRDVGAIRIDEHHTRFEIAAAVADRFAAAFEAADDEDDTRVERLTEPPEGGAPRRGPRPFKGNNKNFKGKGFKKR